MPRLPGRAVTRGGRGYQDLWLLGTIHRMSVVAGLVVLFLFYWIIRKAVRDGMRDAWKRRSREAAQPKDDIHG
jgi:hypothetical protein